MAITVTKNRTLEKGRHVAIYARGKMGKTIFLAEAVLDAGDNGLMVLAGEDGLSEHKKYRGLVPVLGKENGDYDVFGENGKKTEWPRYLNALKSIYTEWAGPNKVLALDCVNLIINGSCQEYCIDEFFEDKDKWDRTLGRQVTKTKREQAMEFGGVQLLKQMSSEFDKFLTLIKYIQNKGTTVYTSWHSTVVKWKNPFEETDYDKVCVDLKATKESNLREMLKNGCSMLLYADVKTSINKKTNRAEGGDRAFLFTESTASFDATKARGINLPEDLEFDFKVFKSYLDKSTKQKVTSQKSESSSNETPEDVTQTEQEVA